MFGIANRSSSMQNEVDAPPSASLAVLRWCLVVFLFSFAFDYKAPDLTFAAQKTGGSFFQFAFLGLALVSSGLALLIGWRHLLVRPGIYLILAWWGYIAYLLTVSFLSGNEPGRILRLVITPLLLGLALTTTHIAACAGMRPGEAVRWYLAAALTSVVWNLFFGIFGYEQSLDEVRMEILSPAIRFLFAWVGCSLLLRRTFSWWTIFVLAVPMIPTVLSITRSLAFPIMASAMGATFCLILGIMWRLYPPSHPAKRIGPLAIGAVCGLGAIVILALAMPQVTERWTERLFHNKGGGATTEDLSSLMRKAEAKAMVDILSNDPISYIYGKGLGAAYYWDESFYPELFQVYPEDRHQFAEEIYTAGHCTWTFAIFSSGIIGVLVTLGMFFAVMGYSLWAAWTNSQTVMGRWAWDAHLLFFPFVAMLCTLSESITRNPFDDRMTGVLFGFVAALPQFFFNRAFYLRHREQEAVLTPQIILKEEDLPTNWEGAFPERVLAE
ncbi:MAG: hypothetical protein KDN19_05585 [Verrucomicrobiae bacterium]|nr:hypothetical protein [Verrucomicrobiae bacterium]